MKKLLLVLLSLLMAFPVFAEDIDLSGLSYAELVALKDRINLAMWQSAEWQEVTVPQGIWVVGEDIPAGNWMISAVKRNCAHIYYGDEISSNGAKVSATSIGKYYYKILSGPDSIFTGDGELSYIFLTLQDGWYFQIEGDSVIFTPYTGKPDLGFK